MAAEPLNNGRYGLDIILGAATSEEEAVAILMDQAAEIDASLRHRKGAIYEYGRKLADEASIAIASLIQVDAADAAAVRSIQMRIDAYVRFAGWVKSVLGTASMGRESDGASDDWDDPGAEQGQARRRKRSRSLP